MNADRDVISFTMIYDGREYEINTHAGEYRNLMVLLNNTIYMEDFGGCGGMGRCATCLVKVTGLKGGANTMARNEMATIHRTGLAGSDLRLACQILITEELNEAVIDISGENY